DTNAIAGAGVPRNRNQHSCLAKPVGRHIAVDSFVLTGMDEVGLVPDASAIGLAYPPPVVAPSVQVRIFLVLGERFEMIERPPVLHDGLETHLVTQQALLRMLQQVVEHVVHASATTEIADSADEGEEVEARADQEDDEAPFNLCCPAASIDLSHFSLPHPHAPK